MNHSKVDNKVMDPFTQTKGSFGFVDWMLSTTNLSTGNIIATVFGLSAKVEVIISKQPGINEVLKQTRKYRRNKIIARPFDGFLYSLFQAMEG